MNTITIYEILCSTTNESYIGSTTNWQKRLSTHLVLLRNGKHSNKFLQEAWNICGEKNFLTRVLEECTPEENANHAREQFYINKTATCYNTNENKMLSGIIRTSITPRKQRAYDLEKKSYKTPYAIERTCNTQKAFTPPENLKDYSKKEWKSALSMDAILPFYTVGINADGNLAHIENTIEFDEEANCYAVNIRVTPRLNFYQDNIKTKEEAIEVYAKVLSVGLMPLQVNKPIGIPEKYLVV